VDDDYLSVSEMNYSNISEKDQEQIIQDKERRKLMLIKNRESIEIKQESITMGP
jgi:hypothetical protein